jgi:hypothetical protein
MTAGEEGAKAEVEGVMTGEEGVEAEEEYGTESREISRRRSQ